MATLTHMLDGMAAYFLGKEAIAQKIGARLYDTIAEQRIVALESPNDERSPRLQQFAEYRDAGENVGRLVGSRESQLAYSSVEFRCYAFMPSDARALLELFIAAIENNSYSGTWTANGNDVAVKGAHWDRATRSTDYDETARMPVSSCILIVPWLRG